MLALIRLFFGLSSFVAPKAAAKLAFRLFCTPQRTRNRSPRHLQTLENARKIFETAKYHSIPYEGGRIAAYEFIGGFNPADNSSNNDAPHPDTFSKTVYVIHGWQSNSLLMSKFVDPLLSKGWRVVLIDLPGHGKSSGRVCHVPLAVSAVHAVSSKLGKCDMIIAHSLGGAIAAVVVAGTLQGFPALPVTRLVTISAPNSVEKIFNDFFEMINLGTRACRQFDAIVLALSGRTAGDFDVGGQLANLDTQMLVIHAPDDKEIPLSEAESIVAQKPDATLHLANGYGHRRIIASEEIVQTAVEFLDC